MKTTVILDDDEEPRQSLGKWLKEAGFAVHKASSLDEFQKIVRAEHIDFALIDLKLDYLSLTGGAAAIPLVKRNQPWSKAIVVTGTYLSARERRALDEIGADAYVEKGVADNYIVATLDAIRQFEKHAEAKRCFTIMPMSTSTSCSEHEWTEVFEQMIKPAANGCGYDCRRSEGLVGNIIKQILDDLNRADLVIADLTDRNPNVFYELGVRHALRDRTVLIAQTLDAIPFDLRQYGIVIYDWKTTRGREQFREQIAKALAMMDSSTVFAASPVLEYLSGQVPTVPT